MKTINDMQVGHIGVFLVCANLIEKGYNAFPTNEGLPFDVIHDADNDMYRIQVKSTREEQIMPQRIKEIPAYIFNVKKHKNYNPDLDSVDIYALVDLKSKTVAYLLPDQMRTTMCFRVRGYCGEYWDEKWQQQAKEIEKLRSGGMRFRDVMSKMNLTQSKYYSILNRKDERSHWGKYLDEFPIESCL